MSLERLSPLLIFLGIILLGYLTVIGPQLSALSNSVQEMKVLIKMIPLQVLTQNQEVKNRL